MVIINKTEKLASLDNLKYTTKKVIIDEVDFDYNKKYDNLSPVLQEIIINNVRIKNIPNYGDTCVLTKRAFYVEKINDIFYKLPFGCKLKINHNMYVN